MKKLFFKYLISIFSITLVTILVQGLMLFLRYSDSQTEWKTNAYEDFVTSLESSIESGTFNEFGIGVLQKVMASMDDDRVSGYVVRDVEGSTVFTFGKTSDGSILATMLPANQKISGPNTKTISTRSKNITKLDLTIDSNGTISVEKGTSSTSYNTSISLPNAINADDVVGSIILSFNGSDLFIIDILTYSPRTYIYSKDIINACLETLLLSIPICLVIALIAAWVISYRNTKYIDSIRKALQGLAKGESNVKVPRDSGIGLVEISDAVEDLDKELQRNAMSRKAWLRSISHDLNTPASALRMIIDGLEDGVFPCNEQTFKDLSKESDTLNARIGKVIDFSTLQADTKPEMEKVPVSVLTDCILSHFGKDANIQVCTKCDEIVCDISLMSKAAIELVANALEYGTNPEIPVYFEVSKTNTEKKEKFCIRVLNKGKVPAQMEDNSFFEPWTRGDWSRTCGGSGLGLPIACTIAQLHNGTIELKNNSNETYGEFVQATITWLEKASSY